VYCYRVRAFNSAGVSPYTNEGCGAATEMLSVGLNASTFAMGQTVAGSIAVNNHGLPNTVDFFVGLLMPDQHTIAFLTSGGFALGDAAVLTSFRSVAHDVSLAAPFLVTMPNFFVYTRQGIEQVGFYTFFFVALRAGAAASGVI